MATMTIYALLLASEKYYIGKTSKDVNTRFAEHYQGYGSAWTKMHPPIRILESYATENPFEEDMLTKKYMITYGIENVRGGSNANVVLEDWQIKSLKNEINSAMDKCYKCGLNGHFALECNAIYNRYLNTFDTEEKIVAEIEKMEKARKMLIEYSNSIDYYKYYTYVYVVEPRTRAVRHVEKKIEINPELIDTYNLRNYDDSKDESMGNPSAKTLYQYFVTNPNGIIKTLNTNEVSQNIVEIIYKIYVHRKKLERAANQLIVESDCNAQNTYEDALVEMNKKIELLYQKYAIEVWK